MKSYVSAAIAASLFSSSAMARMGDLCRDQTRFAIVVHGGGISQPLVAPERLSIMQSTLKTARARLAGGAASLDVVEFVVRTFEDSGAFNAGRGAISDRAGMVETDASIMDGRDLNAGAVASMTAIRNPVHAARLVMEKSPHVLMVGDRGQAFLESIGAERAPPSYFLKTNLPGKTPDHGTVGAVAWDRCRHIAAATSTGGYDAKIPGRVGDSPIVGAGVYADDSTAGLSATGHGEYFLRFSIAKDVADRVAYGRQSLKDAMKTDLIDRLQPMKEGDGALIGIDRTGHIVTMWNSVGLFRGFATDAQPPLVAEYAGPAESP